jgi:RimJ/RimL family protein N-acetyltransferase
MPLRPHRHSLCLSHLTRFAADGGRCDHKQPRLKPDRSAPMTIARTQHLVLRHLHTGDGDAMDRIFGDSDVMRFGDGTKTPEQVRLWINRWIDDLYPRWGFGMWALVRQCDERTIGYCGLSRFPDRVGPTETEIGFRLARPFWGQGFASEAVAAVRDHAWTALKLPKLVAFIDPANVASIRVIEKAGFGYERDAMLEDYDHPDLVYSVIRPVAPNASRGIGPV